jgi:hypothetical protein
LPIQELKFWGSDDEEFFKEVEANFAHRRSNIYVKIQGKKMPPAEQEASKKIYCLTTGGA